MGVDISEQTRAFVRGHRTDDVRDLALHAKRVEGLDLTWALDQIAGWQTARRKLPQWADVDDIIYPPHLAMEQCSSEPTARYKARLAARLLAGAGPVETTTADAVPEPPAAERAAQSHTSESRPASEGVLTDLTGGFGVDFSYMARRFAQAVYVERQRELCEIVRHNVAALGLDGVRIVNAQAESHLDAMDPVDVIYLDPARRDTHGARTYAIADCTPDVLALRDGLLRKARVVIVKLSPMLDWHKAVDDLGGVVDEVHIVAVSNECKELLLVLRRNAAPVPLVQCVNLTPQGEERFACTPESGDMRGDVHDDVRDIAAETGKTSETGGDGGDDSAGTATAAAHRYLYEPNAAIMKAGCFAELGARYGLTPLTANSHLYVTDRPVPGFPGRGFRIDAMATFAKKDLKRVVAGLTQANITTRNFPMTVDQLRRKLKLKDGGDTYLFATTDRARRHILIRATRLDRE